jgi:Fuc2NAc and GlcNAc transferase
MAALAAIGWLDDTRGLRPRTRFASQLLVSVLTVWNLGGLPLVRMGGSALTLGPAGAVLAVVGLIWCINLFNFMDGIDGIAGSQAVLIFAFGAAALFALGHAPLGLVALIIAAASAGFLAWNWPPAKIFMGDVGSGPLGYLIGALAIASENAGALPMLAFALLGGVFIVDATVTLVRRVTRGHNPAVAHRDHAYQRLSRRWQGHLPVTLLALALTAAFGVVALMSAWRPGILVPALVASWVLLGALLLLLERSDPMFPRV